jgi:signal transduction histidine kinase
VGHIHEEFHDLDLFEEARQGIHVLVVDAKLQPVWPPSERAATELCVCARDILNGTPKAAVLPSRTLGHGDAPHRLCFTCPIRRDGRVIGGVVVQREMHDPVAGVFAALSRRMTLTVVTTQAVLLVALAAIAWSARRTTTRAARRQAESERLAAVGNLAAGVAHEIRNPLNTIALTCRYLERLIAKTAPDPALRSEANRNLEIVAAELGRLTRTLDDFVLLAKPTDLTLSLCDLDAVLDDALALFAHEFDAAGIRVVRQRGGPLPVRTDRHRLAQVFANIVRNGLQAMRDGGTLTVATAQTGERARATFTDTGPGVSTSNLHHIFEPYYSTKRSGLGLGLALARSIIEAHGGTIHVANRTAGAGAIVTVLLPLRSEPLEADHGD